MKTFKKEVRDFRSKVISAPEAALFLRIHVRTFFRLVEEGVIPKMGNGKYILGDISEAYRRYRLACGGLEAAQTRLTKAKADMVEIELAKLRKELHNASAVESVWNDNVMHAKTLFLSIPVKIAPELVGKNFLEAQKIIKDAIYAALNEMAEYNEQCISREAASLKR